MFANLQERLGPYALVRELAHGSTAVVHLAEDTRDGSLVALKIASFEEQYSAPEVVRLRLLFANEASLAGRLVHPNVVRMLAASLEGPRQYIAMEYIPGVPLRHYCQPAHLLPRAQVLALMFKCARAIDYVHSCEVLHRDLKPANILLSEIGEVKIIDFGAAQIGWATRTQLGGFLGSPAYMAPEQLLERAPSRATDIYALGVVLFELLTGSHPFPGDGGPGTIQRILHEAPVPLAQLAPDLAPPLVRLVQRAMARDPAERYADGFSLARDLLACAR